MTPKSASAPITTAQPIARLLYDRKRAAEQLCLSTRAIDYLISSGKLKTRRMGRKVMVPHAELTRFAARDHIGDLAS